MDALSGGMKRRLVIARALLSHPTVLVLDEPTTGLDPAGRHLVWSRVLELRRQGATILLSTHNMEEAMALCDRLVIIDGGRVLAQGKPRELVLEYAGREVVEVRPEFGEMESVKGLLTSRGLRVEEAGTGPAGAEQERGHAWNATWPVRACMWCIARRTWRTCSCA